MDSPTKIMRKVRFTLPSPEITQLRTIEVDFSNIRNFGTKSPSPHIVKPIPIVDTRHIPKPVKIDDQKVHGTTRYINGTLKFCPDDYQPVPDEPTDNSLGTSGKKHEPTVQKILRPTLKYVQKNIPVKQVNNRRKSLSVHLKNLPKINFHKKLNSLLSNNDTDYKSPCIDVNNVKKCVDSKKLKLKPKTTIRSHSVIFSPSKYLKTNSAAQPAVTRPPRRKEKAVKVPDLLSLPSFYDSEDFLSDSITHLNLSKNNNESEVSSTSTNIPHVLNEPTILENIQNDYDGDHLNRYNHLTNNPNMNNVLVSASTNLLNFLQFADRWSCTQKASPKKHFSKSLANRFGNSSSIKCSSVHKRVFEQSDEKRLVSHNTSEK